MKDKNHNNYNLVELSKLELKSINGGGKLFKRIGNLLGDLLDTMGQVGWALSGNPTMMDDNS